MDSFVAPTELRLATKSNVKPAAQPSSRQALLLTENPTLLGGPVPLLQNLTERERDLVLSYGQKRVLNRGQTLFNQGAVHDGIYLISTGRIRVFYTAPSGREITLAYWLSGNFVGGPEVFGGGIHQWAGVATCASSVVHLQGKTLRMLVQQIPTLGIGLIEGLTFKGKCYSALAQMLGTRSVTERLAHLLLHLVETYGIKDRDGIAITAGFTHADLAHMVGATRQWVTISLKRLQDQGVIICRKSHIIVCRTDRLAEMRGGE